MKMARFPGLVRGGEEGAGPGNYWCGASLAHVRSFRAAYPLCGGVATLHPCCVRVAEFVGCSPVTVTRIESAQSAPRLADTARMLEFYGVTGSQRDVLMTLCGEARRRGWWHQYSGAIPAWFEVYVGIEGEVSEIPDVADPDVVYVQYRRGSVYLEDSADVDAYAELFDHLRARALGPDESRALIARLADETS